MTATQNVVRLKNRTAFFLEERTPSRCVFLLYLILTQNPIFFKRKAIDISYDFPNFSFFDIFPRTVKKKKPAPSAEARPSKRNKSPKRCQTPQAFDPTVLFRKNPETALPQRQSKRFSFPTSPEVFHPHPDISAVCIFLPEESNGCFLQSAKSLRRKKWNFPTMNSGSDSYPVRPHDKAADRIGIRKAKRRKKKPGEFFPSAVSGKKRR